MVDQTARLPSTVNEALWPFGAAAEWPQWLRVPSSHGPLLTVTTDESTIKFVAFKGRTVVDWATVDLNSGGPFALPAGMSEFAGRFSRQLADLPFYTSITRFLPKPEVKKRFMAGVVLAETAQAIPFDLSEVDITWQEVQGDKEPEIMVTATPKREIDSQIDLLGVVGVRPAGMYSKASALALAAGLPNAVVAHLTASGADLVLVRNDVARTVHQIVLPPRESPDEYAAVLAQAIDELTTFELSGLEDTDVAEIDSIVLTGAVPSRGAAYQAVHSALGHRLRHVAQRVAHPDGFPADVYAANLGLALADWERLRPWWKRRPDVSSLVMQLLPERHQVRAVPRKVTHLAGLAAGLAIMLSLAILASGLARTTVEGLEREVSVLERQARLNAIEAARFNSQRLTLGTIEGQITALSNLRAINHGQVTRVIEKLSQMTVASSVRRVDVLSLNLSPSQAKIAATTSSVTQALAYADALRETGLFSGVEISDISTGDSSGGTGARTMNFSLVASISERAR